MKIQKLSIFTLSFLILLVCSTKLPKPYKKAKKQNWMYVKDSILMCAHEMKNGDYHFYLKDLLTNKNMAAYQMALPDTNVWKLSLNSSYNEPFVRFYFQHKAYKEYPLVGINYEQAQNYCQWLSNKINNDPKRIFKKVIIRLPSKSEWIMAANAGKSYRNYPWDGQFVRNSRGNYLANFKAIREENLRVDSTGKITTNQCYKTVKVFQSNKVDTIFKGYVDCTEDINSFITTPIFSYWPNELGLYNMAGNVSELLAEKNQYIGGDWSSIAYYLNLNTETRILDKPLPNVGFRYLIQVIEF